MSQFAVVSCLPVVGVILVAGVGRGPAQEKGVEKRVNKLLAVLADPYGLSA